MQSVQMHCFSLSVYLLIHLSIYISLSGYVCVYILIFHSIYLSLYMIIIKWYCFQIEQLKFWQKQNIFYLENDIILWWIYILIDISLWHEKFTYSPLNDIIILKDIYNAVFFIYKIQMLHKFLLFNCQIFPRD